MSLTYGEAGQYRNISSSLVRGSRRSCTPHDAHNTTTKTEGYVMLRLMIILNT
jgi:hypothetical protein